MPLKNICRLILSDIIMSDKTLNDIMQFQIYIKELLCRWSV